MLAKRIFSALLIALFVTWNTQVFAEDQTTSSPLESSEQSSSSNDINQTSSDVSEVTQSDSVLSDTSVSLEANTGENHTENSSVIDNFSSGDILGQITSAKTENSDLADNSSIQVKTNESDNQVDFNDFNSMDSSFNIGTAQSRSEEIDNQFLYIDSSDTIGLDLNTGKNEFERNTVIGNAETGDIAYATNLVNTSNLLNPELLVTVKIYTILGDFTGDVVLEDSFLNEEPAVSILDDSSSSSQSNVENISNKAEFDMNTGDNQLSDNSVVGEVTSGNASAGYFQNDFAGLLTKANFFILNVLGDWSGTNLLSSYDNVIINRIDDPALMEAYNADASSESVIERDTTYSAYANTGKNRFMANTFVGGLKTGDISLLENILALKPNLRSLKNFLNIRVLNILGNWRGNLRAEANTKPPVVNTDPSPTPDPNPTVVPTTEETDNSASQDDSGEVLGVQEVSFGETVSNAVLAQTEIDPGAIEAGPNMKYLLLLLPLISIALARRALKSLR